MNIRRLVGRLVVWGAVAMILLVGARYAYAVFGKFGISSPLAWNQQVAWHAIKASAKADWRNLQRLLPGSGGKQSPAEMQNENFGEMRVPISRDYISTMAAPGVLSLRAGFRHGGLGG